MALSILGNLLNVAGQVGIAAMQNSANAENVRQTNENNLQIARETNASNVEQAELAYQRSRPLAQLSDLMQTGLSKQGALSMLNGGGTYTAPTLSSGPEQKPFLQDLSQLSQAMQKITDIPSNVAMQRMQDAQIENIANEIRLREQRAKDEHEQHKQLMQLRELDELRKQYGQHAVEANDKLRSRISELASQKGFDLSTFHSEKQLVDSLGLDNEPLWKAAPAASREYITNWARTNAEELRAQNEDRRREQAQKDAHQLSVLEKRLKGIDVKYADKRAHEELINLMRVGQGLIQDNNLKYQNATAQELENYVRSAGIEDEAEANAVAKYALKLVEDDKLFVAKQADDYPTWLKNVRAGTRLSLSDLGSFLLHLRAK